MSLEVKDNQLEIFTEEANGDIVKTLKPNRFWILGSRPHEDHWVKLHGDLHYKYGVQFSTRETFLDYRRKLRNSDIYSIYDAKEAIMVKNGYTYFKGLKVADVSINSFDIETTGLDPYAPDAKVLLITNTYRKQGKIIRKLFAYNDYKSEKEMIEHWCLWVRNMNPSILCGHNIVIYDFVYLAGRARAVGAKLNLGRNGDELRFNDYESQFRKDGSQSYTYRKVAVYGREVVDTFFLAIKYDIGRKYDNYKLKSIIKHEGLEVPGRVFYDAEKIRFNYTDLDEWEKIKAYAIHDGDDALALFDLMSAPFFYMTQSIPKSFQGIMESASGSQLNAVMVRSYLQNAHSIPRTSSDVEFEGAISFGVPGIYHNVLKVDVASLYPSIMLNYKIYDSVKDPQCNLLNMLDYFTKRRLEYKKIAKETKDKYYDDLQNSYKILINSAYGFMGASGLNFNYPFGASEVTRHGREILTKAIDWAKGRNFIVSNGDTDSISFCKQDHSFFNEQEQKDLLVEINSLYPASIHWEHDGLYKNFLIIKAKNYVLQDMNDKVKIKGSALKATMKEPALQEFIKQTITLLLGERMYELKALYNTYAKEILTLKEMSRWCTKKTVTASVLNPQRTNEAKVLDAIGDVDSVQEGDKIHVYFKEDGSLSLRENFNGDYNKKALFKKLYNTIEVFDNVLDVKTIFPNYSLKRSEKLLEIL